ncbi:hypothetical protein [Streptomyces alkaliterrae]|uniref:Uncharacterized protein n=1 Tax=Streptomyces alkaliterrae TaxID=2213162 RepID=A0A5P0YS35_9ACTN|nr:hypothetical protein [Streptomyces alkaliterrae]MBB1260392.1 hypothetical protein [Streptomyces alkaliterrae]MQS01309.1 hypothetical protein [Streptomyces alkaliterrae]
MTMTGAYLTGPALTEAVHELLEHEPELPWRGRSGYLSTGEQVARHLEATQRLMRSDPSWDPQIAVPHHGRELRNALKSTVADGQGTEDTADLAEQVIELVLRVRTGAPMIFVHRWARHPHLTLDILLEHLAAAAGVAREIGPTASN